MWACTCTGAYIRWSDGLHSLCSLLGDRFWFSIYLVMSSRVTRSSSKNLRQESVAGVSRKNARVASQPVESSGDTVTVLPSNVVVINPAPHLSTITKNVEPLTTDTPFKGFFVNVALLTKCTNDKLDSIVAPLVNHHYVSAKDVFLPKKSGFSLEDIFSKSKLSINDVTRDCILRDVVLVSFESVRSSTAPGTLTSYDVLEGVPVQDGGKLVVLKYQNQLIGFHISSSYLFDFVS